MRIASRPAVALVLIASVVTTLTGCALLFPRFDNPLNPDIAYSNTGDVVDSVKCAVTKFYIDRVGHLKKKALDDLREADKRLREATAGSAYDNRFCKSNWDNPTTWKIALLRPKPVPKSNAASSRSSAIQSEGNCEWRIIEESDWQNKKELEDAVLESKRKCRKKPFFLVYKYVRHHSDAEKARCLPNGGCPLGTRRLESKNSITDQEFGYTSGDVGEAKCILEDTDRFALDPQGKAKIELSLQAVNTGSMSYPRIDFSNHIVLAGDLAKGIPFPMLKATDKKTNKVDIVVAMPQADSVKEERPGEMTDIPKRVKWLQDTYTGEEAGAKRGNGGEEKRAQAGERQINLLASANNRADLETTASEQIVEKCGAIKIEFLALNGYINKVISDHENSVQKAGKGGGLEVALDSIVLTSQFQVIYDANAGTQHLLRIVPVLAPPVLQLNPDHTHTLKLTFQGKKGRAFAGNAKSLMTKCLERFKDASSQDFILKEDAEREYARLAQTLSELISPPTRKEREEEKKRAEEMAALYETTKVAEAAIRDDKVKASINALCRSPSTVLVESLIEAVEANKPSN